MSSPRAVQDGGFKAWAAVLGFAIGNMFNYSMKSVFALLFKDELLELGFSTSGASIVLNTNTVLTCLSGLLAKFVIQSYSKRKIYIFGCLVNVTGIIWASMARSRAELILSFGCLSGLGVGLMSISGLMAVNSYFQKNRGKAVGISFAGAAIGDMIMPYIVKSLLDNYSSRSATLIFGSLALNGVIGGMLLFPPPLVLSKAETVDENSNLIPSKCPAKNTIQCRRPREFIVHHLKKAFGIQLLKDPTFVNIVIGISLTSTVNVNFALFFPLYLQEDLGLTRAETALALTLMATGDVLSRFLFPVLTDKLKIRARVSLIYSLIVAIVLREILVGSLTFTQIQVFAVFYGHSRAINIIKDNLTICEYSCKEEVMSNALALAMITKAAVIFSVGFLLGAIKDVSNSYKIGFHVQNIVVFLVVVSWSLELLIVNYKKKREKRDGYNVI